MKFFHVILPLTVLLLVSCSKEDSNELCMQPEIAVTDASVLTTKGYVIGDTLMEEGDVPRDLYLSAYDITVGREYFVNAVYKKSEGSMTWRNYRDGVLSPVYWPSGSKLDFLAYSVGSSSPVVVWNETNCASGLEMEVTDASLQDDILYAAAYDRSNGSNGVDMIFKHAQAWLVFVVEQPGSSASGIQITGITVRNVKQSGLFRIARNYSNAVASWDFSDVDSGDCTLNLEGTPAPLVYLSVLLPQQRRTSIRVSYISDGESGSMDFDLESSRTWLMGEKYIYYINTTDDNIITFHTTVEPWDVVPETPLTAEQNTSGIGTSFDAWDDDVPETPLTAEQDTSGTGDSI